MLEPARTTNAHGFAATDLITGAESLLRLVRCKQCRFLDPQSRSCSEPDSALESPRTMWSDCFAPSEELSKADAAR